MAASRGTAFALVAVIALCLVGAVQAEDAKPLPLVNAPYAPEWWQTALAALMIGAFFVAVSFMAGEFLMLPSAKSVAKQEAYELAVSGILIMLVMGLMMAWGIMASGFVPTKLQQSELGSPSVMLRCPETEAQYGVADARHPENLLYASANFFLGCEPAAGKSVEDIQVDYGKGGYTSYYGPVGSSGVLLPELMNQYVGLLSLEMLLGPVSTFGTSFYTPEALITSFSVNIQPNAGLAPISEITIAITDLIGVGVGTVVMQKILLLFIHQNVLVIFLPLGLALRGVPFLRKTGSTIVAICLILYFVYPLTIWINQQIYFSMQHKLINWADYSSIAQICQLKQGESLGEYQERVKNDVAAYYAKGTEIGSKAAGGAQGRRVLPYGMLESFWESTKSNVGLVAEYLFGDFLLLRPMWVMGGPVLPTTYLFEQLVDILTVSTQALVLNLFFVANSILISFTLFRDVSLAIGGEPRIFGISKLV